MPFGRWQSPRNLSCFSLPIDILLKKSIAGITLNLDILIIILDYLYNTSSKSIYNVALASRSLYRLTYEYRYRKIRLTLSCHRNQSNGWLLGKLLGDEMARSTVHEVYINWIPGADPRHETEEGKKLMEQLIDLIPRLTALRRLIYDAQCPILPRLLLTLTDHVSKVRLYTRCPYRSDVSKSLRVLQNCSHLVALDVTIGDSQILAMVELRKILVTLPNLLKLSVESVADSLVEGGQVLLAPMASRTPSQAWCLPPLKYLRLWGRGFQLADYASLRGWEFCVQWERLEHLESSDTFFFTVFDWFDEGRPGFGSPLLKSLRSLALSGDMAYDQTAFVKFLDSLPKLEHLSARGLTYQVTKYDYLERKGSFLKTLRLYEDASIVIWSFVGPERDDGNIRRFGKTCPNLETCAIDLRVLGNDWPWDLLTRIAESLTSIIHLELIVSLRHDSETPQVTLDSVRKIWSFLWHAIARVRKQRAQHHPNHPSSKTTITTPRLRTLKICTADTEFYTARFEARLAERDDLAAQGHAEVVFLELEGLREKYGTGKCENGPQEKFRGMLEWRAERGRGRSQEMLVNLLDFPQARPLETVLVRMAEW
ncbi:MAG: hypothetical protein Q9212_003917 [Teloschistes hypoglaucus]